MSEERRHSSKRYAIGGVCCPNCRTHIERDADWCDRCGFTGSKSMDLFGDSPPPLLPILDAVGLWSDADQRKISKALASIKKRFPQIRWKICAVRLEAETALPLFGFWLMNLCPLIDDESDEDREWTILLLIDEKNGRAAAIPGYQAELWVSDEQWEKALATMSRSYSKGRAAKAVLHFLSAARAHLETASKRLRHSKPSRKPA